MNAKQLLYATACVKATGSGRQGEGFFNEIFPSRAEQLVITDLDAAFCVVYLVEEGDRFSYVQKRHLTDARAACGSSAHALP